MDARTDLDDLDVVVRRRNGRYVAKIPQIGLYAAGESLPHAIAALESKKKSLQDELAGAGALDEIAPARTGTPRRMLPALALFSAKAGIVLLVLLYAAAYTERVFERQVDQFRQLGGASFWAGFEQNLARAAEPGSDMPAEKKQQLIANLHVIVERWRPVVREAQRLFTEPAAPPPPGNP